MVLRVFAVLERTADLGVRGRSGSSLGGDSVLHEKIAKIHTFGQQIGDDGPHSLRKFNYK